MKTLKIIRLLSLIGALGIIAAYTITNAVKGEMETFNWVVLAICVVIAVFGIASDAQREKHPRALVQYTHWRTRYGHTAHGDSTSQYDLVYHFACKTILAQDMGLNISKN